jgi:hypothetical protein
MNRDCAGRIRSSAELTLDHARGLVVRTSTVDAPVTRDEAIKYAEWVPDVSLILRPLHG